MLHLSPTNLSSPSRLEQNKNKGHKEKRPTSRKRFKDISGNRQETGPKAEKGEDRSNRTRHNNKIVYRKMESNDSPDIPDTGETSEVPGLPLGLLQ